MLPLALYSCALAEEGRKERAESTPEQDAQLAAASQSISGQSEQQVYQANRSYEKKKRDGGSLSDSDQALAQAYANQEDHMKQKSKWKARTSSPDELVSMANDTDNIYSNNAAREEMEKRDILSSASMNLDPTSNQDQ